MSLWSLECSEQTHWDVPGKMSDDVARGRLPDHARQAKGRGKKGMSWTPVRLQQLPDSVPDDDGLENVLVHVYSVTGEWLWSDVCAEHLRMDEVQHAFWTSGPRRYGPLNGYVWRLMWNLGRWGPYPRECARSQLAPGQHVWSWRDNLNGARGVTRSSDTREVWITAVRTPVWW